MRVINTSVVFATLVFVAALTSCTDKQQAKAQRLESNEAAGGLPSSKIKVQDYLGRQVVLDRPAQRIIALSPHIVENTFSAGAGDRLVAAVDYSDYPEAAREIPRLGGYSQFNIESMLAYQPDLVIAWASGNSELALLLQKLESFGVAVYVDEPRVLTDIARSVRDIGQLAGTEDIAEVAAGDYLLELEQLRSKYAKRRLVTVFYQIWDDPLQTLNGQHMVSAVIELCGGENIFSSASAIAPMVNIESVIAEDPELMLAAINADETRDVLSVWRRWPALRAVKNNLLFQVPADWLSRQTVRMSLGADKVCQYLQTARQ